MGKPRDEGGKGCAIAVFASLPVEERLNTLMGGAHNESVHMRTRAAAKSEDIDKGPCDKSKSKDSLRILRQPLQ